MTHTFDIVLSRSLAREDARSLLRALVPPGLVVHVATDIAEPPDDDAALWAVLVELDADPDWPCMLNVVSCTDDCGLAPYPDLRIAAALWARFGIDALCATWPFVGPLDPHHPYWWLACVQGTWHLASTAGTRLMGPYGDDPGGQFVVLVRPVEVPW